MTDYRTEKPNTLLRDLKKYVDYFFERKGFTVDVATGRISEHALRAAKMARGADRGPAIIIQGAMPRCGTVYVGELLSHHPALHAYPHKMWEFPALKLTPDVIALQKKFVLGYKLNWDKLGEADFLPLIGATLLAYLHEPVPPGRRVLAKMPSSQYLNHFFDMFPHEHLLVLVRDGRDLVHSTLRTWPRLNFIQVCLRWNRSARMVVTASKQFSRMDTNGYWLARYEDALHDPEAFVSEACRRFDLDETAYPTDQIDEIRVIGSSKLEKAGDDAVTWQHLKRPENFRPTQYWKQWSRLKRSIFKVIAGRSLMDLGYCDDLSW